MRDMVFADFLERLSQNNEWALKDSIVTFDGLPVSAAWLWHDAQRMRKMAEHVESRADAEAILAKAIEMEGIAKPGLAINTVEGFRQVPDSPKYGKLRGLWLRSEIWNDLFGNLGFVVDEPSMAEQLLGQQRKIAKFTQLWKLLKVPFNPPTLIRNTVGNLMLLQFSGVPIVRLPDRLIQAAVEMAADGRHWQAAKRYGVSNTNFAHAELCRLDRFARSAVSFREDGLAKIGAIIAGIADKAGWAYGMLEA